MPKTITTIRQGGTGAETAPTAINNLLPSQSGQGGKFLKTDGTNAAWDGGASATETLTNKRITKRITTQTSSATPTINTDNCDIHKITALAVNITSMSSGLTGTPTDGQMLMIQITGTGAMTITWGASFESSTVTLPSTTVSTNRLDVGLIWNASTSKWRCIAVS